MSTSATERKMSQERATGVVIGEEAFTVCLADGRRISVPYYCFPRLEKADMGKRSHFEVYAEGKMLHWPEIDEDIEVQHIVEGRMPVKAGQPVSAVAESKAQYGSARPIKGGPRNTRRGVVKATMP